MIPGTLPYSTSTDLTGTVGTTTGTLMATPFAVTPFTVTPFGGAVLVTVADASQAAAVADALRARLAGVAGAVVPGAESVLVHPITVGAGDLTGAVTEVLAGFPYPATEAATQSVRIGVRYDGEDLPVVADLLGVSVEEVIARHTGATYTVDFLGFAPGFPYLSGLDPFLSSVPRLDTPRSRVPAGAVGLAAGRTCIYPTPSPGGWHLLGATDAPLFDPTDGDSPALLAAGMQVVFEAVR